VWLAEYLHELTVFPNGKHDDQADSTAQFLGEEQHRQRQIEDRMKIDHQPHRSRLDLRQQPDELRKKGQHDHTACCPHQQITERQAARGRRAGLEQRRQGAAEVGARS